jgi:hypothetical protein
MAFYKPYLPESTMAFLPQIARGEILWCQVPQGDARAQPLMILTTQTLHQRANHHKGELQQNIGCRGLSYCANHWESIPKFVYAEQE